ncbi:hypothetical protein BC938DRAFT_471142 [Jimgerdemannia flammicorona]|uniref:Uncharacterized protein n=1 Tax=Jimgerdemannia flammicorona TaxID=994334 RepID=A0A433QUY7_9FUNG|nr:hypothetical protein BC938DRAFT_471142 [Jimgerdemannia flammicorona]
MAFQVFQCYFGIDVFIKHVVITFLCAIFAVMQIMEMKWWNIISGIGQTYGIPVVVLMGFDITCQYEIGLVIFTVAFGGSSAEMSTSGLVLTLRCKMPSSSLSSSSSGWLSWLRQLYDLTGPSPCRHVHNSCCATCTQFSSAVSGEEDGRDRICAAHHPLPVLPLRFYCRLLVQYPVGVLNFCRDGKDYRQDAGVVGACEEDLVEAELHREGAERVRGRKIIDTLIMEPCPQRLCRD